MNKSELKGIPIAESLGSILKGKKLRSKFTKDKKRLLFMSIVAVLVAVAISFIAKFLIRLIDLITNISFYGKVSVEDVVPEGNTLGLWVIIVPVIGGIIVGIMALYGSKAIRGHGIPEAMEMILTNKSKIKPTITYLKPVSSAIAIGSGGPFGSEGPIIATGAALGSTVGQILKISDNERKILLAAGATAGMAAIFGTPIAGIFLAIELLLFEYSPRSIIPVALACITGAAGHHLLFGHQPVFAFGDMIAITGNTALFIYSVMGIIIGLLSVFTTKLVYFIEDVFEKIPIHWMWYPAIGGLAVGIIGYIEPKTLGVGYQNITDILSGSLSLQLVASLCVLKFLSWAIALGSNTSGGTLAPLLTIGGAIGLLLGTAALLIFPNSGVNISLAALVGMAAMFAGTSRALITSIIFALESTGQSNATLPLLACCSTSYMVSFFMMKNTIMTEKIARRGVITPDSYESNVLERLSVAQFMQESGLIFSEDNSLAEVKAYLDKKPQYKSNYLIVSNNNGAFKGIVSLSKLYDHKVDQSEKMRNLLKTNTAFVKPHDTLRTAVEKMAIEEVDVLPVITEEFKEIKGILTFRDVLSTYKNSAGENIKRKPNISLKRKGLKILLHGQKLVTYFKSSD